MRGLLDYYWTQFKLSFVELLQYRVGFLMWALGMVVEPVIYLVVWRTVALSSGGAIGGYTAGDFVAYYVVWTLVRQMNIGLTPYVFEGRIQHGTLSPMLLRPIHLFHQDLADFNGLKVVTLLMWLPVGALLAILFRPSLNPALWQVIAFLAALLTGYVMRFTIIWALGMASFWVTRISAILQLYGAFELLLSGRLVPLALLPDWARRLANWLPFQWGFGFPIELLLGKLTPQAVLVGFLAQGGWFLFGAVAASALWRLGVRRYSAVGA